MKEGCEVSVRGRPDERWIKAMPDARRKDAALSERVANRCRVSWWGRSIGEEERRGEGEAVRLGRSEVARLGRLWSPRSAHAWLELLLWRSNQGDKCRDIGVAQVEVHVTVKYLGLLDSRNHALTRSRRALYTPWLHAGLPGTTMVQRDGVDELRCLIGGPNLTYGARTIGWPLIIYCSTTPRETANHARGSALLRLRKPGSHRRTFRFSYPAKHVSHRHPVAEALASDPLRWSAPIPHPTAHDKAAAAAAAAVVVVDHSARLSLRVSQQGQRQWPGTGTTNGPPGARRW
nr:hypothetical protein CFP56_00780 [Quercus suber]